MKRQSLLTAFSAVILCLFLLVMSCKVDPPIGETPTGTDPSSPSDPSGPSDPSNPPVDYSGLNRKEVLETLGVHIDESDPTNANGETVEGNENPMGSLISNLGTQYEFFQVGATMSASYGRLSGHEFASNGTLSKLSDYSIPSTNTWLNLPKKSVAADLDQDGKDEIITAVFNGPGKTISIKTTTPAGTSTPKNLTGLDFMGDFGAREWLHDDYFMRDFTTGDFNNDGFPDFAVSCKTGVLILDKNFNITGSFEFPSGPNSPFVRVEAGDLNGDSYDDLVVFHGRVIEDTGTSQYYIFKGGNSGLGIPKNASKLANYAELSGTMQGKTKVYTSGEVVIFDYNGDGLNELFVAGILDSEGHSNWNGSYAYLVPDIAVWDPYNEETGNWIMEYPVDDYTGYYDINANGGIHPRNIYVPRVVSGNFDGAARDMCNVMDLVFYVDNGSFVVSNDFVYTSWDNYGCHNMCYDLATAGDMTGDGCDELAYIEFTDLPRENDGLGGIFTRNNTTKKLVIWGKNDSGSFATLKEVSFASSNEFPILATGNVDDDTVVVKYDHYEQTYSDPVILAVLASAPYCDGIMEIDNSETAYTLSSETETTNSGKAGFYVKAGVGLTAEQDIPGGGSVGFQVMGYMENSFSWGWGQVKARGTSQTFTVDAGSNQVVFAGFPIDVYVYKILSGPKEFTAVNGEYLTINIPRTPETSSAELSHYNSIVGEEFRIPAELINHTIGDPHSYYKASDKNGFVAEGASKGGYLFSDNTLPVTQGHGHTEINTWDTTNDTSSFEYSLTLGQDAEIKAGYVAIGLDIGVNAAYTYEHNVGSTTEVGGVVGSVPDATAWGENKFNWGLMMIPRQFNDQKYNFVTYWIE